MKVKLRSLARDMEVPSSPTREPDYPDIFVPTSALPEIENWENGGTYHILVEVCQVESNVKMPYREAGARLQLKKIGAAPKNEAK